jgi:hypothetical protein
MTIVPVNKRGLAQAQYSISSRNLRNLRMPVCEVRNLAPYRSLKYAAPTELAAFDTPIGYKYVAPKELARAHPS